MRGHTIRTAAEMRIIADAKLWLMRQYNMTEANAYAWMRTNAMESQLSMVEIARRIMEVSA